MKRNIDDGGITTWIFAAIIAVMLVILAIGLFIPSGEGGEGDFGGVAELTLVVENQERDGAETLTLEIPNTVSLTGNWLRSAGILDNPSAFTTITDPDGTWAKDDTIKVHAAADVWWSGGDIESVDNVSYKQVAGRDDASVSLQPKDNPWTTNQGNEIIEVESTGDHKLKRSEDDARSYSPGDEYFVERDDGTKLIADEVDESGIQVEVVIEGTDVNGDSFSETISIFATIELEINEDGSMNLGLGLMEAEPQSVVE